MKSTTTLFRKVFLFGAMVTSFFAADRVKAQNPCNGAANYGCGGRYGYCGDIDAITVKNSAGTVLASYNGLKCNNATTYRGILNQGSAFDLTAGEEIEVTITGTSWNGYATRVGLWMDVDLNKQYSKEECLINPSSTTIGGATTFKLKVPCFTKAGSSYLRVRGAMTAYQMNANQGCGTVNSYGNLFDLEVNYKLGATPVADFVVPTIPKDTNWVSTNVKFPAKNPNNGATYTWSFEDADGVVANSGQVGEARWDNDGKYDVFMKVDYCGIADSTTKTVTITTPTVVPVADFIASSNEVELGYDVKLYDLSSSGATEWDWELNSPTGVGDWTSTEQNPTFEFYESGWYEVCLTSGNAVGYSQKTCKQKYIECLPTLDNYMGPQKLASTRIGRLFDHAGPTGNYANNRKTSIDYFKILPCGAEEIRLEFADLALADDNDVLTIYDGADEDPNTVIAEINKSNQAQWDTTIIKCTSGSAYITFESNGSGVSRGFAIEWESDLETPTAPSAAWSTPYTTVGVGVEFFATNETKNAKGAPEYEWTIDGNPEGFSEDFSSIIYTNGTYKTCLIAKTCTGIDTACKNITITTPNTAGKVDFVADNVRPNIGQKVSFKTTTDYANKFDWSIFPTSFKYVNGTTKNSQNPQIEFLAGGAYTFTLSAWSADGTKANTDKKVIKNKYVICLNYCTPLTNLTAKDISINSVLVTDKNDVILVKNADEDVAMYTDRTDKRALPMTFGATYDIEVGRLTAANDVNYKVWIDWNIDGDFDDAGEEVMSTGKMSGKTATGSFTVPALKNSFEGRTRMRIGASYDGFANRACGVNLVGEFEDYAVTLENDGMAPQINLVGDDTVRVERGTSASSCYEEIASKTYTAIDGTEGDLTNDVVLTSDLDCQAAGVYSINFDLEDASGNKAETKTRTIIVVLDRTGPVLTLQGDDTMTIEQCGTFTDPGAVANDAVDGDLTSAIKVNGTVDPSAVGDYLITYVVKDAQSNETEVTRLVQVRDTKNPGIYRLGNRITDGMSIEVQINQAFVDDIYAQDECNGNIDLYRNPGFNGVVNNQERATYPIVYNAQDPSGNKADEDGYTINYIVDDFVAPNIELNTNDTVYHDVNSPYSSRSVTVTDNYYDPTQVSTVRTGKVDPFTLGTYVETFIATDGSGNKTTKMRYVKVVDREAPNVVAPPVSACVGTPFWAMSGLILTDNYYSRSELEPLVEIVYHNINIDEAGIYSINYRVSDPSGNESSIVSRTVYVQYPPNCQNTFMSNEDLKLSDAVNVKPNPTSGKVTVSYALNNNEPLQISVVNAVGAVVTERTVSGGFGEAEFDLSAYGRGMYLIRMTNNGQATVKKLIVKD